MHDTNSLVHNYATSPGDIILWVEEQFWAIIELLGLILALKSKVTPTGCTSLERYFHTLSESPTTNTVWLLTF